MLNKNLSPKYREYHLPHERQYLDVTSYNGRQDTILRPIVCSSIGLLELPVCVDIGLVTSRIVDHVGK